MRTHKTQTHKIQVIAGALVAAVCLAMGTPAADAAKRVSYKGKTTGGHPVTFKLGKSKKMWDFVIGVPMNCLAIQGGGAPITGAEVVSWKWVELGLKGFEYEELVKPSFHYNEVTRKHTVTTYRARNGTIAGSMRVQYQFMIPKFPIGTFTIYSCLGNTKFSAKPV